MSAPYSPGLKGTLGALEIGTVVGTFLFGILTLQTFNYYRQFPEDSKTLKVTVAVLWLLELGQTICAPYGIYNITVTFYGQPPNNFILNPPEPQVLTIFFSGTIDALVQIFFGNRIRVLSGRSYIFFLCIALAILGFVCDIILLAAWIPRGGYAQVAAKEHWEVLTTQIVSPTGDIAIALYLCYWLWRVRRGNTEFNRTRRMVDNLILWTCETTLVTSGAGIVQLILFLTRKDLAYIAVFLMQPKLFSNAMMASLNGRARFRFPEVTITGSQPLDFDSRSRREDGHRIPSNTVSRMRSSAVVQIPHTTEGYNISKRLFNLLLLVLRPFDTTDIERGIDVEADGERHPPDRMYR